INSTLRHSNFTHYAHRNSPHELRLKPVLQKILRGNMLEELVVHHLNRLGSESDLPLPHPTRDLLLQLFERTAYYKKNVPRVDCLAFRLPAALKLERRLELRLKIVHAAHGHLGFLH